MAGDIKFKIKKVADLIPYAKNSRIHDNAQIAQLAASIKEFGFTNPVLIGDDNVLIAGHGRVLAAQKLRLREIPAMVISGLTETQRKALVLADNRLALSAGWDEEMLGLELKALQEEGYNLELTGFDERELEKFLAQPGEDGMCDPDEVPEEIVDPITKLGDTWILGSHRLRCGDSTVTTDVEALLGGVSPHLMVTDPPYGVEYDASWRNDAAEAGIIGQKKSIRAIGKVMNDDRADWTDAWALFPGEVAYVWHAGNKAHIVAESLIKCDFEIRAQIVWAKNNFAISRGHYHPKHEPCWYAVRKKGTGHWNGDRKQTTLWDIPKPQKSETGHSTQKPVECMKRPIENNSSPGQAVYEPFSGSGTTIIAGQMTGRSIYAMELSPVYVDMAVQRWEKFTGKKAILESTGAQYGDEAQNTYAGRKSKKKTART